MEKYRYSAIDEAGKKVSGVETARRPRCRAPGPARPRPAAVEVSERKSFLQFEITKKTVPRKDIMHFSRQLSVFIKAGIPIMEALEVIAEETTDKLLKRSLYDMIERLAVRRHLRVGRRRPPGSLPQLLRRHSLVGRADRKPRHRARPAGRLSRA